MAFASWWYKMHANEKTNGSSYKQGEKKGPDEKAASFGSTQPARTHAAGAAVATKASVSSASANKSSSMNSTEPKAIPVSKQMEEQPSPNKKRHKRQKEPEKKSQSSEPAVTQEKKEAKTKEHTEPKSLSKRTSDTRKKHAEKEKAASKSSEQSAPEKAAKPKDTTPAVRESVDAAVSALSDKPEDKSGMDDAALDDLIDTLGEPEETEDSNTTYTGPVVSDPMFSKYVEELGKREVTIPPKYRELLNKNEGTIAPPPDSSKPMGPDDAIDALSSDFTCSSNTGEKKTDKEKSTGEVLKAQSAKVSKSAAPPQEKKRKVEEDSMSDQALEALSASLGHRKSEPELDISSIKEVDEAKAKEEKLKKCGEDDETVPSEYRLKAVTDKDGKPLLPTQEEKSKPLSESELIDELSEDFDRSKCKEKQSKPTEKTEKPQASASTPVEEAVPRTSMCTIQSAPPKPAVPKETVSDDAVEALAGSLGKKEADPEDAKPVEDKVKDKAKEEDREKLGEKEETIPPEYRLEEVKDKDGKPLLPQKAKEPLPAMTEDFLLDALSEDFAGPTNTSSLKFEDAKLSAVISEVVSQTPAPATHAAGPPPDTSEEHMFLEEKPIRGGVGLDKFREVHREKVPPTDVRGSVLSTLHSDLGEIPGAQSDDKARDDALDQLSDSLGQRQPDPDDDKPLEDKVKERAKAEHRDKLGERDDTIPPEYRHLLDNDNEGKPKKPPTKKPQASKKTSDDQDPIDTLSGDFDSCPSTTETSENRAKDKDKKAASNAKAPKSGGKAKSSAKAKEETSKPKASEKNSS